VKRIGGFKKDANHESPNRRKNHLGQERDRVAAGAGVVEPEHPHTGAVVHYQFTAVNW
jgi:hypothetical protein